MLKTKINYIIEHQLQNLFNNSTRDLLSFLAKKSYNRNKEHYTFRLYVHTYNPKKARAIDQKIKGNISAKNISAVNIQKALAVNTKRDYIVKDLGITVNPVDKDTDGYKYIDHRNIFIDIDHSLYDVEEIKDLLTQLGFNSFLIQENKQEKKLHIFLHVDLPTTYNDYIYDTFKILTKEIKDKFPKTYYQYIHMTKHINDIKNTELAILQLVVDFLYFKLKADKNLQNKTIKSGLVYLIKNEQNKYKTVYKKVNDNPIRIDNLIRKFIDYLFSHPTDYEQFFDYETTKLYGLVYYKDNMKSMYYKMAVLWILITLSYSYEYPIFRLHGISKRLHKYSTLLKSDIKRLKIEELNTDNKSYIRDVYKTLSESTILKDLLWKMLPKDLFEVKVEKKKFLPRNVKDNIDDQLLQYVTFNIVDSNAYVKGNRHMIAYNSATLLARYCRNPETVKHKFIKAMKEIANEYKDEEIYNRIEAINYVFKHREEHKLRGFNKFIETLRFVKKDYTPDWLPILDDDKRYVTKIVKQKTKSNKKKEELPYYAMVRDVYTTLTNNTIELNKDIQTFNLLSYLKDKKDEVVLYGSEVTIPLRTIPFKESDKFLKNNRITARAKQTSLRFVKKYYEPLYNKGLIELERTKGIGRGKKSITKASITEKGLEYLDSNSMIIVSTHNDTIYRLGIIVDDMQKRKVIADRLRLDSHKEMLWTLLQWNKPRIQLWYNQFFDREDYLQDSFMSMSKTINNLNLNKDIYHYLKNKINKLYLILSKSKLGFFYHYNIADHYYLHKMISSSISITFTDNEITYLYDKDIHDSVIQDKDYRWLHNSKYAMVDDSIIEDHRVSTISTYYMTYTSEIEIDIGLLEGLEFREGDDYDNKIDYYSYVVEGRNVGQNKSNWMNSAVLDSKGNVYTILVGDSSGKMYNRQCGYFDISEYVCREEKDKLYVDIEKGYKCSWKRRRDPLWLKWSRFVRGDRLIPTWMKRMDDSPLLGMYWMLKRWDFDAVVDDYKDKNNDFEYYGDYGTRKESDNVLREVTVRDGKKYLVVRKKRKYHDEMDWMHRLAVDMIKYDYVDYESIMNLIGGEVTTASYIRSLVKHSRDKEILKIKLFFAALVENTIYKDFGGKYYVGGYKFDSSRSLKHFKWQNKQWVEQLTFYIIMYMLENFYYAYWDYRSDFYYDGRKYLYGMLGRNNTLDRWYVKEHRYKVAKEYYVSSLEILRTG